MSEEKYEYIVEYDSHKEAEQAIKTHGLTMPKDRESRYEPPGPYRVRALIEFMGWEQAEMAKIFDVNVSTVRRWCSGHKSAEYRAIPYATWLLALTMAELIDIDKLRAA